jgi:hypothetical protein
MHTWPLVLGILAALAAVVLGLKAWGEKRWAGTTEALLARLEAARRSSTESRYHTRQALDLPAPVRRYFDAVLKDGQCIVSTVSMEHTGTFNLSPAGDNWKAFVSRQRVTTSRPGFVWDARVTLVPGLYVLVHDAYVAGEGSLNPAVLGMLSLGRVQGLGEIARGELLRYLAESPWYPTVLLPGQGVTWEPIDDHSARATLVDGTVSASMVFRFGADDLVESATADARAATVDNVTVMMPWECRLSNYQSREGMRIPLTGEAAWLTPQGRQPYYRGTIETIAYEWAWDLPRAFVRKAAGPPPTDIRRANIPGLSDG